MSESLQAAMDDVARREVEQQITLDWRMLAALRGDTGATVRELRGAAWRGLRRAYATRHGASLGLGDRLVRAGVVWPTGRDE